MMTPVNIMDTGKLLFLGILAARLQIMKHPPNGMHRQNRKFLSRLALLFTRVSVSCQLKPQGTIQTRRTSRWNAES